MRVEETVAGAFEGGRANPMIIAAITPSGRLLGLDAGDWAMIVIGIALSVLLVAVV